MPEKWGYKQYWAHQKGMDLPPGSDANDFHMLIAIAIMHYAIRRVHCVMIGFQ